MAPQRGRSHQQDAQLGMNNQFCKLLLFLPQLVPIIHMSNLMEVGMLPESSARFKRGQCFSKKLLPMQTHLQGNKCMFSHWKGALQQQTHLESWTCLWSLELLKPHKAMGLEEWVGIQKGRSWLPPGESSLWAEEIASWSGAKSVYEFLRQRK